MSSTAAPIRIALASSGSETPQEHCLARFHFGIGSEVAGATPVDRQLALPAADGAAVCEEWRVHGPVTHAWHEGFACSFAAGNTVISWSGELAADVRAQTTEVYTALLRLVRELDCGQVVKIWNHVPDITRGDGDQERYRQFCLGRGEVCDRYWQGAALPAGTAVGAVPGAPLQVILLAQAGAPLGVENPRQMSAFRYPSCYGPHSPSFSRAALSCTQQLFLSGTASILGHESQHRGNFPEQLRETVRNWRALVRQASRQAAAAAQGPGELSALRVYLRDPQNRALAREILLEEGFDPKRAVFLEAAICRRELLFEMDGVLDMAAVSCVGSIGGGAV